MRLRFLHVMINVFDLERSVGFYVNALGMRVLRRIEAPDEGRRVAFVGYSDEVEATAIELTFRTDSPAISTGGAMGHIAVEVSDVFSFCDGLRGQGVPIVTEPFRIANGKTIAFVADPDGNAVELVQPAP